MYKKRVGVFYRVKHHEAQPSRFSPGKTRATSFLNGFENISGKACVNRKLLFCEGWKSVYEKKIRHWIDQF